YHAYSYCSVYFPRLRRPPTSLPFPYTTLFRSAGGLLLTAGADVQKDRIEVSVWAFGRGKEAWLIEHRVLMGDTARDAVWKALGRSEEHTSELQSRENLVCRLLLEKKK